MRKLVTGKLTDDSDQKDLGGAWDIGLLDGYHSSTQTSSCFRVRTLRTACLLPHPFICEFAFPFSCRAARGNGYRIRYYWSLGFKRWSIDSIYSYLVCTKATLNKLNTGNSYLSVIHGTSDVAAKRLNG